MKTPEEMAEEYRENHDECEFARDAFLAGYKAGFEQALSAVTPIDNATEGGFREQVGAWLLTYEGSDSMPLPTPPEANE